MLIEVHSVTYDRWVSELSSVMALLIGRLMLPKFFARDSVERVRMKCSLLVRARNQQSTVAVCHIRNVLALAEEANENREAG